MLGTRVPMELLVTIPVLGMVDWAMMVLLGARSSIPCSDEELTVDDPLTSCTSAMHTSRRGPLPLLPVNEALDETFGDGAMDGESLVLEDELLSLIELFA